MYSLRSSIAVALLVLGALAACAGSGATTGVIGRWRDPTRAHKFHNILVVGISERTLYRRLYEDEFVKRFSARGITATPSYLAVPGDSPTREQLEAAMTEKRCDAVLVTHLVDVDTRRQFHEGTVDSQATLTSYGYGYYNSPYYAPMYGAGFGPYYSAVYNYTHTAGYYEEHKSYNLETTLYDASDSKLVWALMSKAIEPKNITHLISGVADTVFTALQGDGLL